MKERACCFIGHRNIKDTPTLRRRLSAIAEALIQDDGIDTFLFGSKSQFTSLCYEIITRLKDKYPHIRRIYIRAETPYIDTAYREFLSAHYEDTCFPSGMNPVGKSIYVERNCQMINRSQVCVFYYSPRSTPPRQRDYSGIGQYPAKSGTKIAYDHAVKKGKRIVNTCA